MDFIVDRDQPDAVDQLVEEIGAFLLRHGRLEEVAGEVETTIGDLLARACGCAGSPVRAELEWSAPEPHLTVLPVNVPEQHQTGCERSVSAWLPVRRRSGSRFTVRPEVHTSPTGTGLSSDLPEPGQFGEGGGLRSEPFLRALLVLMARSVEQDAGPVIINEAIMKAGASIGNQLENAFRRNRRIVERLSPERIGELFVSAIGGDFYLIEVTDDRIVLGNRRCPFGDAVKDSPSLCRMTSSVFGGIAARNAGQATVSLDARIAIGDPECRIVVTLGAAGDPDEWDYHYGGPLPVRTVLVASPLLADLLVEQVSRDHIDVVATTGSTVLPRTHEEVQQLLDHRPDLLVVQASNDHQSVALDLVATARAARPDLAVALLCDEVDSDTAHQLLDLGDGVGYLLATELLDTAALVTSLQAVASGGIAFSPGAIRSVGEELHNPLHELTPRERTVLSLIASGLSNAAIAERLVVSRRAIEKHLNNTFRKLAITDDKVDKRVQATLLYQRWHDT